MSSPLDDSQALPEAAASYSPQAPAGAFAWARGFRKARRLVAVALVGSFAGSACGEGTAPPPAVVTVSITPSQGVEVVPGGTQMLVVTAKDAKGNTLTDRITTWSSSDETKATVAGGLVTGVGIGSATVTASVDGKVATVEVQVKDGAVVSSAGTSFSAQAGNVNVAVPAGAVSQATSITVAPTANPLPSARLLSGSVFDFGPVSTTLLQPIAITIRYNPALVTAGNSEGELMLYEVVGGAWRAIAGSTANTSETTVSGAVSRLGTYAVMLLPRVETVTIAGDLSPMAVVTTRQLSATLRDVEGTTLTRPTAWSSSDPAILSVDPATGVASAKKPGSVTITATSEGKSGTATMSVVPGPPAKLVIAAGNNQSVAAGQPVPVAPAVLVTDAGDNPIANVAVSFTVASGGGSVTGASGTTNASGIATAGVWTLGTQAGPNTLTASSPAVPGVTVTFQAAGGAGPAAKIEAAGGGGQTGTAGGLVATAPSVRVTDANGNFVSGFTVTFSPGPNSGSVTGAAALTDAAGIATVGSWRLGTTPGSQTLVATASGLSGSPVTISATAVAPVASKIEGFAGNNQAARPGFPVATPPSVLVTDPAGIPVPGVAVTFAITAGGGSITGAEATTNSSGIAAVGSWRLGPNPGINTLTATAGGLSGSPVTFNASAETLPPATIAIHAGNNQTAMTGQAVPIRPAVRVTDVEGMPVPGVRVTFSIRSGTGTITGTEPITDASGIATLGSWVLGLGGNSLFASVAGITDPLVFVGLGTAEVQIVTFGDSNTDLGFQGAEPSPRVASYISSANPALRLNAGAPASILQLAGKIEARWRANSSRSIKAVNHGIAGTLSGPGRTIVFAPNAREQVGGVTRFRGEALGDAYPWSGGEPVNEFYPSGAIPRVQAFSPRATDFAYISIGTNDIRDGFSPATVRGNLEIMVDEWIGRGLSPSRLMITTLAPRPGVATQMQQLNSLIRTLAATKGIRLIDIADMTSNDNGATWKSSALHVGDQIHYSEVVRDMIADVIVSIMLNTN